MEGRSDAAESQSLLSKRIADRTKYCNSRAGRGHTVSYLITQVISISNPACKQVPSRPYLHTKETLRDLKCLRVNEMNVPVLWFGCERQCFGVQ